MELLDYLGLADRARNPPDALSGGQQQRIAVACALCVVLRRFDLRLKALVPIAGRTAAEEFLKDHHGSRILAADEITLEVLRGIAGKAPGSPR